MLFKGKITLLKPDKGKGIIVWQKHYYDSLDQSLTKVQHYIIFQEFKDNWIH